VKNRLWPYIAVIVLLGALAYSNTLHSPFVFDDEIDILNNSVIRDMGNIPGMFAGKLESWASRPLMNATFAVNYAISGYSSWSYHAANLALHLINTVLLFWLIVLTGRHAGYEEDRLRLTAVLTAALFALHPVQTEGVTYIMSRSALLAACAFFAGLILFLKAATSARRKWLYAAGLFVVSLAGMASRENFMVFPVVLVVYDLFFIARLRVRDVASRYAIYLPVFLSLLYMGYLTVANTYDVASEFPGWGIPPVQYVLTQFKVHWSYVRMLAFPVGLTIDHDFPLAKGLMSPDVLLAAAAYACLWLWVVVRAKRWPAAAFGVFWFLIILAPVSFALGASGYLMNTRLGDVMAEHRMYLPSAGIFLAVSAAASSLAAKRGRKLTVAVAVVAALSLVLAAGTHERNKVWKSPITLWQDAVKKSPGSFRAQYNLGNLYLNKKMYAKAVPLFRESIRLKPDFYRSHFNLGIIYYRHGMIDESIDELETVIRLEPSYYKAHLGLVTMYHNRGDDVATRRHLKEILWLWPGDKKALDLMKKLDAEEKR